MMTDSETSASKAGSGGSDVKPRTIQEKLATGLVGLTVLEPSTFVDIALRSSTGLIGEGQRLVELGRTGDAVVFEVRSAGVLHGAGLDSRPYGRVLVGIGPPKDGSRRAFAVGLDADSAVVIQSKVLMVIPIMPKQLIGWKVYSKYLAALRVAIKHADPAAEAEIGRDQAEAILGSPPSFTETSATEGGTTT